MTGELIAVAPHAAPVFPEAEVRRRLRAELRKIADQGSVLRPEWVPLLDSKRIVGTVLVLEDLFDFKVPPDRVVRRGGYQTLDEAEDDMLDRIEKVWVERSKPKVRR